MIPVYLCLAGEADPLPECRAALAGADVYVVRATTVWQARAKALAAADAELIAFVDGDVVVPAGWMAALERAWSDVGWEIAAIGGPVDGEAAGAVAGTVDWGEDPLDVDPLERTLPAANLSFRRRALIGAGGFGATIDGRDARDWLAEEHEAQRQLGHWGWLVRYDPRLRARRVGGWAGAPHGGRYRYGVRMGSVGSRSAADAARAFGRGAVGTLVAAATGRGELRRQRAAYVAENSGVLVGLMRARTSGDPDTNGDADAFAADTETARRRAATGARRSQSPAPFVLLYHRVAAGLPDPLGLCVAPDRFQEQLAVLAAEYTVVPMDQMAEERRPGTAALTFDDGYADNVAALASIGIPVTLFAATGLIACGGRFFWDEAARLLAGPGPRPSRLTLDVGGRAHEWPTRTAAERARALTALHHVLQPSSRATIDAALARLATWAGPAVPASGEATRLMTVGELIDLARRGVDVAAHTRTHVNLVYEDESVVRDEIEGSRADIEAWTGAAPRGFAYPFGIPRHDVDARARTAAAAAGYDYAVVNQPAPIGPEADRYALPRLVAPDVGADGFRARLRRITS